MSNDRKQLIRLAASRPVGDPVRRVLLGELQKQSARPSGMSLVKVKTPNGMVDGYIDIDRQGRDAYMAFLWLPEEILDPGRADVRDGYVRVAETGNSQPYLYDHNDEELVDSYVFLKPSVRGNKIQWINEEPTNWDNWEDGDDYPAEVNHGSTRYSEQMEDGARLL
jgi:hypothetical protein|tara:strand:- start:53 stop:550 length:498 start_codon:yes stop_codon:yes gene_type:complete